MRAAPGWDPWVGDTSMVPVRGVLSISVRPRATFSAQRHLGLSLLPADTRRRRDLPHPRGDLACVEFLLGPELYTTRCLAHRHRGHWRYGLERDAVHEHELDMI